MTVYTADLTDHLLDAFYSTAVTPEVKQAARDALLQDGYALLVCKDCGDEAIAVGEGDEADFTDHHSGCAEGARLRDKRFAVGDEVTWDVAFTGHVGRVVEFCASVDAAWTLGQFEVRSELDGTIHYVAVEDLTAVHYSG